MRNVTVKYRETLPPSLRGLNMHILPKEKIGIVGRTGIYSGSLIRGW